MSELYTMASNITMVLAANVTNSSHTHTNQAVSVLTGFLGFSIVASLLFNGIIIIVYFKDTTLRNSFNALIAHLCVAEVLLAAMGMPANFLRGLYGYFPLSTAACTFFLYCNNIFGSMVRYGHVLIAGNRLWAVTYPLHYRKHHNLKVTYATIALVWVFVNVLHLSLIVPGRTWMKPNDTQCVVNVEFQRRTALVVEILGFTITEIIVVALSAFVSVKINKQNRIKSQRLASNVMGLASRTGRTLKADGSTATGTNTNASAEPNIDSKVAPQSNSNSIDNKHPKHKHRVNSSHNRVLIYLVVAVIICWTPNHIYWLLVDAIGYWNNTFLAVQFFAVYTNSWLNPILCYLALKELRKSVNKLFSLDTYFDM